MPGPTLPHATDDWLTSFEISPDWGFLPEEPPLQRLPEAFGAWEEAARGLSHWLRAGQVREFLAALPLLDASGLASRREAERAMLLLSFFGHAFHWQFEEGAERLPACIAASWQQVARRLGRPPVLSHASVVLQNWRLLDPEGPRRLENLAPLMQFLGGKDEAAFYLHTVQMEAEGATLLRTVALACRQAQQEDPDGLFDSLVDLANGIRALTHWLQQLPHWCDPYIFYHRVRPYLASLDQVYYEGAEDPGPHSFHGGSAAQSSLLPALDQVLGVQPTGQARVYLQAMRRYMPPAHARWLTELQENQAVLQACKQHPFLEEARGGCLEALTAFRNAHLEIVRQYILEQDPMAQVGTGGTALMDFLQSLRDVTQAAGK